jgi:hypothetical protein
MFDQLDQLVEVIPLVSRYASGEWTREPGCEELCSTPLSHCLEVSVLRRHFRSCLRLLCTC